MPSAGSVAGVWQQWEHLSLHQPARGRAHSRSPGHSGHLSPDVSPPGDTTLRGGVSESLGPARSAGNGVNVVRHLGPNSEKPPGTWRRERGPRFDAKPGCVCASGRRPFRPTQEPSCPLALLFISLLSLTEAQRRAGSPARGQHIRAERTAVTSSSARQLRPGTSAEEKGIQS